MSRLDDVPFDVGHAGVHATWHWPRLVEGDESDHVVLEYTGTPEALIAANVATPELLLKQWSGPRNRKRPKGCNRKRRDADGDTAHVVYRRGRVLKLRVKKSLDNALRVPGFSVAPLLEQFTKRTRFERNMASREAHVRRIEDRKRSEPPEATP